MDAPRTLDQRKKDTLHRLEHDVDAWVATAAEGGVPCLVPLSIYWDGRALYLSTNMNNPTAVNLRANGQVRLTLGETRDVVLIEGVGAQVAEPGQDVVEGFAARAGFDPSKLAKYPYYRVEPRHIQAWREVNEIPERDIMRDGEWL